MWKFEIYRDRDGEYRWRIVVSDGSVVGDSAEGYDSRLNARRAAAHARSQIASAVIEDA
jgi:uncharacterized protein YegP (UPF0339 family)